MRPDPEEPVEASTAPATVRDVRELILAATARIIRERGLGGATTKAIAEEARCAEGSIYRYFPNKDALFIECVKEGFPEFIQMVGTLPDLAGKGSARHHLEELVKAALAFYRGILPMVAGTMADRELMEEQRRHFVANKSGPMKSISSLAEYIRREQRLGRCSDQVPPEYAARLLMGACFSQAYLEAMLGPEAIIGTDERFARMIVRGLLEGLDPRKEASGVFRQATS